jgi:3-deoxy-D-manno-octulosonic-acid transferase
VRQLYSLLFYALAPLLFVRLLWKSGRTPAYRERIPERFGFYRGQPRKTHSIWIHAVSVGECEAAFPIIKALMRKGETSLLITCTTPTGSARVREVLGKSVEHVYLPYDLPDALHRFFRCFRPRLALIMETEIWPNLFHACGERQIPLAILNGRLSEKSARGYANLSGLVKASLSQVTQIAAQTRSDADRYLALGAIPNTVSVLGNIKFDIQFDETFSNQSLELRRSLFSHRPVWIAGSTHPGEEALILDALAWIQVTVPDALLVLAPRHPERSGDVRALCEGRGLRVQTRSEARACDDKTSVFLIDGIGELRKFYGAAVVAFVGGSLIPHGGQNVLEAAAVGVPVIFGPYMMNFDEISRNLLAAGGGVQIDTPDLLAEWVARFLQEPSLALDYGQKGKSFVENNRGALDQVVTLIDDLCSPPAMNGPVTHGHS